MRETGALEARSRRKESSWAFCLSVSRAASNYYLRMICSEKLIKAPLFSFPVALFENLSLHTQFLAQNVYWALFFWLYPGSVFAMFSLTKCPKELVILIAVKKEQEYKVHAAL